MKSTIRTYYGADSTGIANKTASPYISEMDAILGQGPRSQLAERLLRGGGAAGHGGSTPKPAIVFDADDTTLWTYDMEDRDMQFVFDPVLQNV